MREIKFRGKRIDDNEWIKGQLLFFKDSVGKDNMTRIAGGCEWNNRTQWYSLCNIHSVVENTIGQYTGLKDKNGKEVYIGDILEYTFTDYKGKELWIENYIVKENISGWEMRNITKPREHRSLSLVKNYKVIGNIYDNPELLEV